MKLQKHYTLTRVKSQDQLGKTYRSLAQKFVNREFQKDPKILSFLSQLIEPLHVSVCTFMHLCTYFYSISLKGYAHCVIRNTKGGKLSVKKSRDCTEPSYVL